MSENPSPAHKYHEKRSGAQGAGPWGRGDDDVNVATILERIEELDEAIGVSGDYLDPYVGARAQKELRVARERLNAGLGLTVAALAGGTGSGKSSLFNALTGLEFAKTGDIRPTTHDPSACVWNAEAGSLLDMIGVPRDRRIAYESILTAGDHDLDSLVLVDLPDHDSVDVAHSAAVSRILPKVDVLIWVLDPQKYADHLIHDSYLAAMRERREHMIVVLNQTDVIPEHSVDKLVKDVKLLLERDGLAGVPVFATSAKNGEGLKELSEHLRHAVQDTEAALHTAAAELETIRERVASGVGSTEAEVHGEFLDDLNDQLVVASGIPAVEASLRQAGKNLSGTVITKPEQPSAATIVAARDSWLAHAKFGLPAPWRDALEGAIPEPEAFRRQLGSKIRAVPITKVSRGKLWGLLIGLVLLAACVVLGVLGIPSTDIAVRGGIAGAGLVLFLVCFFVGRRKQRASGDDSAREFAEAARLAVSATTAEQLVKPSSAVLDKHRTAREALRL
ncbi:MAG: GTPase [Ancrocorticia sp.]|uniref:GTPase n=1 Tax=Ancrocorticia sp. TaxID=2593684 RepID=UPI003F92C592